MNSKKILWEPDPDTVAQTRMAEFCALAAEKHQLPGNGFWDVHAWSAQSPSQYWKELWSYAQFLFDGDDGVVTASEKLMEADWFPSVRLNYAENILNCGNEDDIALIGVVESGETSRLTFGQLRRNVAKTAAQLKVHGVAQGDRVAAVMPNGVEAIVCALACASIGAVWASASPDLGLEGCIERFSQIDPVVLITIGEYTYNGKHHDIYKKTARLIDVLPSLKAHICFGGSKHKKNADDSKPVYVPGSFSDWSKPAQFAFERVSFNHPLYILFSSGTTGVPKCIVHGHGGVLLAHSNEMLLHSDMRPSDRLFFYTTCGWMMWNWMISALGCGASVVAYDGSPAYENPHFLWSLADQLEATHLGMGAKYVSVSSEHPWQGNRSFSKLKTVLTTGSPLTEDLFRWLAESLPAKVRIASMSGGTDIVGCFVAGSPTLPVHLGEIQCPVLGMDIAAYDVEGKPVIGEKGDLVCRKAFPNAPVSFWNDPEGIRYRDSYFGSFPEVWTHGDFISISKTTGGIVIYGRSDATLNPGGVRIGPAEIYRHVEACPEVSDSLAVGWQKDGDEKIVLFIVLAKNQTYSNTLGDELCRILKLHASPRHVPWRIFPVPDIPRTLNGKKMELPIKKILAGQSIENTSAMANPESLTVFSSIREKLLSEL